MRTSAPVQPSAFGVFLAAVLATSAVSAQQPPEPDEATEATEAESSDEESAPQPKTLPADAGFGQNQLAERYHFPDEDEYVARVDARDEYDATGHRTILLPTAHTPEKWTVSYSNFMLFYNQLSVSVSDDVQLGIGAVLPTPTIDFVGGASAKFTLSEGPNVALALQPFATHRNGRGELATNDAGVGMSFLADFIVSNNLVTTLGATAYGTLWASTSDYTYENCESRSDFLDGACRETELTNHFLPSGGHWLALHASATYYLTDNFSLRGELITGGALGSVLGTEWLREDFDIEADEARFLEGTAAIGVPYSSDATAGAGLAWSNGMFAVSFSGYVFRAVDPFGPIDAGEEAPEIWALTPMLNLAATL